MDRIDWESHGSSWMMWLGWLGVALIIIPKINIVAIRGQNAGLRIDDFLIAASWIVIIWHVVNCEWKMLGTLGYLKFIGVAALSVLIGRLFGWHGNVLYPLRLLEYFTFVYFGYFFSRNNSLSSALILILVVDGGVMVAQALGLLGGFSVTGYVSHVGRVIGFTSGPWEIGYVLNLVYVALIAEETTTERARWYLTATIAALLVLTQSRASEASFLVIFLMVTLRSKSPVVVVRSLLLLGGMAAIASTWFLRDLLARNSHLLDMRNLRYVVVLYRDIHPPAHFSAWQFKDVPSISGVDPSWLIRSTHWVIAFKEWSRNPPLYLTGLGFGVFGPALDGGWLRLLVETGFLGVLAYAMFLRNIWVRVPSGVYLAIATILNMIFIDMQLSYKGMALLLFLIGFYRGKEKFLGDRTDFAQLNWSRAKSS